MLEKFGVKRPFSASMRSLPGWLALLMITGANAVTPADSVEFDGHYYYLSPLSRTTWSQARAIAASESLTLPDGRQLKGHLVTIESQEEQDFVSSTFMTTWWRKLWLGGYEYSPRGDSADYWAWISGEDMGNMLSDWRYTFLDTGQPGDDPNPFGNENALRMLINNGSGGPPGTGQDRWDDFSIDQGADDSTGRFVIEFDEVGDNFVCMNLPPIVRIVSGGEWKSSDQPVPDWETPEFDDSQWDSASAPYPSPTDPASLIPGTLAEPMWHGSVGMADGQSGPIEAYFRYSFTYVNSPAALPPAAIARISVDDDYDLYVNGLLVFENHDNGNAEQVDTVDLSPFLRDGRNSIAIHAVDGGWDDPRDRLYERVLFDATITPSGLASDLNGDCCVDRADLNRFMALLRGEIKPISWNSLFDFNGDGEANVADARVIVTRFTRPRGQSCSPAASSSTTQEEEE